MKIDVNGYQAYPHQKFIPQMEDLRWRDRDKRVVHAVHCLFTLHSYGVTFLLLMCDSTFTGCLVISLTFFALTYLTELAIGGRV